MYGLISELVLVQTGEETLCCSVLKCTWIHFPVTTCLMFEHMTCRILFSYIQHSVPQNKCSHSTSCLFHSLDPMLKEPLARCRRHSAAHCVCRLLWIICCFDWTVKKSHQSLTRCFKMMIQIHRTHKHHHIHDPQKHESGFIVLQSQSEPMKDQYYVLTGRTIKWFIQKTFSPQE